MVQHALVVQGASLLPEHHVFGRLAALAASPPPLEGLARRHPRGLDDLLVASPVRDVLNVAVIKYRYAIHCPSPTRLARTLRFLQSPDTTGYPRRTSDR